MHVLKTKVQSYAHFPAPLRLAGTLSGHLYSKAPDSFYIGRKFDKDRHSGSIGHAFVTLIVPKSSSDYGRMERDPKGSPEIRLRRRAVAGRTGIASARADPHDRDNTHSAS
ncbi:hypothetical protein [Novosphingobium sp. PC22D]|uniref:hypothetical protein n=1 Tax=Novosphingobium sp. PC22D TaxID=1962403 RepID=UPI00143C52AB|nr:hypothetical protein [Novosphingobium sp. PC22D]